MKFAALLLLLLSCSQVTKYLEGEDFKKVHYQNGESHIVFSNNINGETHPCGCRQFPLGGMPQVWGIMNTWKTTGPQIYVDTGDTFFSSIAIPANVQQSQRFTAEAVADFLDQLNLQYMVPGDQDFALGIEFLDQLQKKHQFKFIITNANNDLPLGHLKFARLKLDKGRTLYFLGVLHRELAPHSVKPYLLDSAGSIASQLKIIDNSYGLKKSDLVVLLSHSGIDQDKVLANQFPRLNWIIGAHTQSFLRVPYEENGVNIVQVLSRNHYLGKIQIESNEIAEKNYLLQSVSDEWQNKITPNPVISQLATFKTNLQNIQKEEEATYTIPTQQKVRYPTANACLTCHVEQYKFWQGTAHSLAFLTLIQKKAEFNSQCIGCHSLYHQDERGFQGKKDIVDSSNPNHSSEKYWQYIHQLTQGIKSVRGSGPQARKSISNQWAKWDQKNNIIHNNANVQCLHCHQQPVDHPFSSSPKAPRVELSTCLQCHTKDQAPDWYDRDGRVKSVVSNKLLKEIACPKKK